MQYDSLALKQHAFEYTRIHPLKFTCSFQPSCFYTSIFTYFFHPCIFTYPSSSKLPICIMSENLCDHPLRGWKCQFNSPSGWKLRGCFCWCAMQLGRSIPLACHYFELWPYTPLVYLVITKRNTRAASDTPVVSAANTRYHLRLPPNTHHVLLAVRVWPFSNFLRRPFHKTLPVPARVWPPEGLLSRPASHILFFERLQQRPFGQLQHDLTYRIYLSLETNTPPLWTTSTQSRFDLRETSVTTFTFSLMAYFCSVPTVLSRNSLMGECWFFFRGSIFCCV